jgi:MerR family transcriptional regulator, copper efflux regulator
MQSGANMRIGEAASETGVTVKAIRHYEAVGLLGILERDGSYRDFSADDFERHRLIAHRCSIDLMKALANSALLADGTLATFGTPRQNARR